MTVTTEDNQGKSGRGISPLAVRRDVHVQDRIDLFVDKLIALDDKYMPDESLRASKDKASQKKYADHRRRWISKLRDLVKTEKRYLGGEGTSETRGKAKMRASSFQVRLSHYKKAIIEKTNVLNPDFRYEARKILADDDLSDSLRRILSDVMAAKKYSTALKRYRDALVDEAESMTDMDYARFKALKKSLAHPVMGMLTVGARISAVIKQQSNRAHKIRHTTAVRRVKLQLHLSWMRRILTNYMSHDWKNLAIALTQATGRRPIELFLKGNFVVYDNGHIKFSGQAKKKLAESKPYVIPVLYDAGTCVAAVKRLRSLLKLPASITPDQVNKKTAKPLANRMKQVFGDDCVEFYAIRSIYARYAVKNFYSAHAMGTEEAYLASILGHEPDDLATVQHYKTVLFNEELTEEEADNYWATIAAKVEKEEEKNDEATAAVLENIGVFSDKFKGAKARVYDFIVSELKKGNKQLTQSYITREGGFSIPAIRAVLADIGQVSIMDAGKGGAKLKAKLV
ncbi:MAG TPA: protelomerase family protein [Oligoflexus sp.]|uniref:protelomerase family protein n=1 Tax=Oligoflexus sp. TaxID=1971216 RepID=UPI002D6B71E5|nr:protelomerase family protein [Oligoflexus sp.]HYX39813.1 protelomerase family protein [Oligoflexus sp.]HYX39814.1 protelomerase family protein [Oligoflexus sp.]